MFSNTCQKLARVMPAVLFTDRLIDSIHPPFICSAPFLGGEPPILGTTAVENECNDMMAIEFRTVPLNINSED